MDGGKDWLECILKKKAHDESPIKILEVDEGDSAPGKGENFLSTIRKIRAKVLLGSGRIKNVALLIKCQHESEHMKKMSIEGGVFVKEITMYRDVLPKMQILLDEISDPEVTFWPKCYDLRLYDRLAFEDLGESGYRTADRRKQLGLNASLMALKYLAKFHALSRILLDKGEIPLDIFGHNPWTTKPETKEMTKGIISSNIKNICKAMETWGEEWKEAIERLKVADLGKTVIDSFQPQPDFTVLCHGDSWTNNILFKGEDLENPVLMKLIDFQLCFVKSPLKDICQFLTTSVRLDVRIRSTDQLLQTYCDTLNSYLMKLGYNGTIPTFVGLKTAFDQKAAVCMCDAFGSIPIVLGEAENAPDIEEALKKAKESEGQGEGTSFSFFNHHENLTPAAEAVIKYEIKRAMALGTI